MRFSAIRTLTLAVALLVAPFAYHHATVSAHEAPETVAEYLNSKMVVGQAQGILYDQHYYYGPINDRLNHHTCKALKHYQADHSLAQTGEIDLETARTMGLVRDNAVVLTAPVQ